ncbi:MAG: ComEC/Rec2 family competence protein [Candidatus Wildermuthbacteria bacterium]|nr:ComEC/Rec2 family competence protein [Candidatus Wildermuthbacteria bacterium]
MEKKGIIWILGILAGLNFFAWLAVYDFSRHQLLEVNFFDVGQGDSAFIETPKGRQILIDGGPSSAILEKLSKEMPFWDRTIDLVILTHPEKDHMSGLLDVLKRYKVENILWTGVVRDTAEYKEWEKLIKEEGARIIIAKASQKIIIARSVLAILYPLDNLEGKVFKDSNNTSIVIKLSFGENNFLFTGDALKLVEKEIIGRGLDIKSDVLKIGHHGSKTSSGEEFIEQVSPAIAVISAGRNNSYGHPHQEVLDTLNKYGITVLRTDQNGDIKIISNGDNFKLITSKI